MMKKDLSTITVIGQGVMGPDIALAFAMGGYEVIGVDILREPLERAARKIASNCRQLIEGGMMSEEESEAVQARISLTLEWETSAQKADYVMEAVPEDMKVKKEVFTHCGDLCSREVVVASNTSSMSISEIASAMNYPERAITTHWTIPAHLSPMVEVAMGRRTSQDTYEMVMRFLKGLGKIPIRCQDTPGFVHNYIQFAMVRAALDLVESGSISPSDIDAIVRNGFGLRVSSVGPLQFVDLCGLDTFLNIQRYMYDKTGNPVYLPSKTIEQKVSRGELGLKSGKGFYDHEGEKVPNLWEQTNSTIISLLKSVMRT